MVWDKARVGMTKSSEVPFQSLPLFTPFGWGSSTKISTIKALRCNGALNGWGVQFSWSKREGRQRALALQTGYGTWHTCLTSVFRHWGLGRERKTQSRGKDYELCQELTRHAALLDKATSCHITSTPSQHAEGTRAVTIRCPLLFPGLKPNSPTEGWKVPWRCLCLWVVSLLERSSHFLDADHVQKLGIPGRVIARCVPLKSWSEQCVCHLDIVGLR